MPILGGNNWQIWECMQNYTSANVQAEGPLDIGLPHLRGSAFGARALAQRHGPTG